MFSWLTPYLTYIKVAAYAAIVASLVAFTVWVMDLYHTKENLAARNEVISAALADASRVTKVTSSVLSTRAANSKAIAQRASNVQVEIEKRIPADGLAALPGSFRVLHDSAAADELPPAPGGTDEAAVTVKEVARTVAGNYEICHDNADRLRLLQLWAEGVTNEGK